VHDTIPQNFSPDTTSLRNKLFAQNTGIASLQKQIDIARLSLKETFALRYPKINLNADYGFLRTDNSTGSILMNRDMVRRSAPAFPYPYTRRGH